MKKHIISFTHQPKKVIVVSLIIATGLGIFGYYQIHQIPTDQLSINNGIPTVKNIPLSFISSGTVDTVSVKIGDQVKKGQVLATLNADNMDGSFIQAKATYEIAKANYEKIINGATGATVDLAKAALNTATVNLDETNKQQEVLVNNAYKTLLNSFLQAQSISNSGAFDSPTISGTYTCKEEGSYNLEMYSSSGGFSVNYTGLETGTSFLSDVPRPLGNCGLLMSFDKTKTPSSGAQFTIQIPNKSASNYSSNYNAYQLALQNRDQAVASGQAILDQANASLQTVVTSARPEDVAVAKAQIDNAYGALISNPSYNNTIISAPGDGKITEVYISAGQIITPNTLSIGFLGLSN